MNDFKRVISSIAAFCFSISLAIFIVVDKFIMPVVGSSISSKLASILIVVLSSIGIYAILFKFVFWLYQKYLHKMIFRLYDITGEWYHIGTIEGGGSYRHGNANIISELDGITLSGLNYRENGEFSSSWQSEAAAVINNKLVLLFISEGVSPSHPITRGAFILNLAGSPPVRMSGVWNDMAPHKNRGTITLFKDKEEYERNLEAYASPREIPE